jgi:hypothetical protein
MSFRVQVRDLCFESNSSSTHSVSVAAEDVIERTFPQDMLRAGLISLHPNPAGYGWGYHRYYRPENILAYFVSLAYGQWIVMPDMVGKDVLPKLRKNKAVDRLISHMEKEHRCQFEYIYPEKTEFVSLGVYVDSGSPLMPVLNDWTTFKTLMFGRASYLQTGNDNQGPPLWIKSDLGDQLYDPSIMRSDAALTRKFRVSVAEDGKQVDYLDDEGHAHNPKIRTFDLPHLFGGSSDKIDMHFESCAIDMKAWERRGATPPDYKAMAGNILFDFIRDVKWKQIGTEHGRIVTMHPDLDISLAFNGSSDEPVRGYSDANSFTLDVLCDAQTLEIVRGCLIDAYTAR